MIRGFENNLSNKNLVNLKINVSLEDSLDSFSSGASLNMVGIHQYSIIV